MRNGKLTLREKENFSDIDVITSFLVEETGKITLTQRQQAMLERLDFADNMLRNEFRTEKHIVEVIHKRYGVSKATALSDVNNAKQVYGSINKLVKNYYRQIVVNMALETFEKARTVKDLKSMNDATSRIIDALGLKKDDPEMPNFKTLEQHNYFLTPATAEQLGVKLPEDWRERLERLKQRKEIDTSKIPAAEVVA